MTLEQMREFVILAEEHNYLIASAMLNSSQASISRHIMALENELGTPLLIRTTKKFELTQEGYRFLAYARQCVNLYDSLADDIDCARNGIVKPIRMEV